MDPLNLPKKQPTERALIAVGMHNKTIFLAIEGNQLEMDIDEVSPYPDDVIGDHWPEEAGIYYWEGVPHWYRTPDTWLGGSEEELEWREEIIRKATQQDLEVFGLRSIFEKDS